jgi:Uma2 family endonuclease
MKAPLVRTRRWTRREYERLVETDILGPNDKIELLEGQLVVREPQHSPHATATRLVQEALRAAFAPGWDVRAGLPLALGRFSEPEPDVSVVRGSPRDFRDAHPMEAVLVVEVAKTSLRLDRSRKARVYARAGVPDYWIVNLVTGVLEVYREPVAIDPARRRWEYRMVRSLGPDESISPLAAPHASIAVADLLP